MITIKKDKKNKHVYYVNDKYLKVFTCKYGNIIVSSMDLTTKEKEALETHLKSIKQ